MENTLEYFLVPVTDYSEEVPEWKRLLPPGMTFDPEDIEIFKNYLLPKVKGEYFTPGIIQEVDVYQCQPSQLPGLDPEHGFSFYFTKTERKYENGLRTSRRTKDQQGNWKITSKINKIKDDDGQTIIGKKNVLVYYMSGNNVKTNWIMHEYILDHKYANQNQGDEFDTTSVVFCRIYERKGKSYGSWVSDIQENHKRESSSQSEDHHEETRCNYQTKRSKSPLYVQPVSQQPPQPLDQVAASNYMITSSSTTETTFNIGRLSTQQGQLYNNPFDVQPISQQPATMMQRCYQPLDQPQLHQPFDIERPISQQPTPTMMMMQTTSRDQMASNNVMEVTNTNDNNNDFETDSFFIGGYF